MGGPPFLLSSADLTTYQRCRRKWLLEQYWRVRHWRPKSLFDACLRSAIVELSSAIPVEEVISHARNRFLNVAREPGLDLPPGSDSYTIAMDWCAMLSTILTYLSHQSLMVLKDHKGVRISNEVVWMLLSHVDDSGVLHRWITVDRWDQQQLAKELHGWFVFGDVAAANTEMMLHVIVIGQTRAGRRQSPWARAFKHPSIAMRYRFQKQSGEPLEGDWRPTWFADGDNDPEVWVELMEKEGVPERLVDTVRVTVPADEYLQQFREQVQMEARDMQLLLGMKVDPLTVPMCRSMCDGPTVCPFQNVCYAPSFVDIEGIGLYDRKPIPRPAPHPQK